MHAPDLLISLGCGVPDEDDTRLLKACLYPAEEAARALALWFNSPGDPAASFFSAQTARRRLAPLLAAQAHEPSTPRQQEFHLRLRAAALYEQRRSDAFRDIVTAVLQCLDAAAIPVALSRGTALAEIAYASPVLRHCHDLDLLVRSDHVTAAAGILTRQLGLGQITPGRLKHSSGMPVCLHTGLLGIPAYDIATGDAWANGTRVDAYGTKVSVLSPTDMLGHIVVHGTMAQVPGNVMWVSDAWQLLRGHSHIDWNALAAKPYCRVLLPGLDYLGRVLGAPIPPEAFDLIRERSHTQSLDTALFALGVHRASRRAAARAGSWRAQATLLRWLLAPSPAALKATATANTRAEQARYYIENLLNLAKRAVTRETQKPS